MNHFRQVLLTLLSLSLPLAAAEKPPNIVIFLVDDMGWGDLGCYGNEVIHSPNLDSSPRREFVSPSVTPPAGYAPLPGPRS